MRNKSSYHPTTTRTTTHPTTSIAWIHVSIITENAYISYKQMTTSTFHSSQLNIINASHKIMMQDFWRAVRIERITFKAEHQ